MINLYSHGSPNGHKVSIALEELRLAYSIEQINVFAGDQFNRPDFLKLNPNAKIPVIQDTETGLVLTESNAILLYLADKVGKLIPQQGPERWRVVELLFFQAASIGPMFGQRAHFTINAPDAIPYAIKRYLNEGERLHGVLERRLEGRNYFLEDYSIVDIAHFGWMHTAVHMGFLFENYPNLQAWYDRVAARPAVQKGINIPSPLPQLPLRKDLVEA